MNANTNTNVLSINIYLRYNSIRCNNRITLDIVTELFGEKPVMRNLEVFGAFGANFLTSYLYRIIICLHSWVYYIFDLVNFLPKKHLEINHIDFQLL